MCYIWLDHCLVECLAPVTKVRYHPAPVRMTIKQSNEPTCSVLARRRARITIGNMNLYDYSSGVYQNVAIQESYSVTGGSSPFTCTKLETNKQTNKDFDKE